MSRSLLLALVAVLFFCGHATAQKPPAKSAGEPAAKGWPDLAQARRHVVEWFGKAGKKPISPPGSDRVVVIAVGQTQLSTVDVGPLEPAFKPSYRELDVPEGDGVAIAMRAYESLSADDQQDCAKGPLARSVTLRDRAGNPVVVQHMFSDCLTPALMVGIRTAPGNDASFAEPLARAAMEAARKKPTPKPAADAKAK